MHLKSNVKRSDLAATLARCALGVAVMSISRVGLAVGVALSPTFATEFESEFTAAMNSDSALRSLLAEAIKKSGRPNLRSFLEITRTCELPKGQAAKVQDRNEQRVILLTRELAEPDGANETQLVEYYQERARKTLPPDSKPGDLGWRFESDFVVVTINEPTREICVQYGITPANLIEYFAHELVHYARAPDLTRAVDPLAFADSAEYARLSALETGDEVEAYKFEYALRARRKGRQALGGRPFLETNFDDRGQFTGHDDAFAAYVLDELGYRTSRFDMQYKRLLQSSLQLVEQRLGLARSLLTSRKELADEYRPIVKSRSRLVGKVWGAYRLETEKISRWLRLADASIERLEEDIPRLEMRAKALKARIK